jgi:hypothetical protein
VQQSNSVYLRAGQRYYMEILHHEIGGEDFLRLAWQTPGSDALDFIPVTAMRPCAPDAGDPLGFGYPQSWRESTGLSSLSLEEQAPWADPMGGGLTNLEKYTLGLNPLSLDSDNDGISDWEEVKLVGSNAALADFDGSAVTLVSIKGSSFISSASTGAWQITGDSVYSAGARGSLLYNLTLPEEGTFRLLVTGGQYLSDGASKILLMDVYADDVYVGRATLDLTQSENNTASAVLWLPNLASGAHTIRLEWLNGVGNSSLRVDSLAVEKRGGAWMSARQNTFTSVDEKWEWSYTSPFCLEGRALDASALQINTNYVPAFNATDAYSVHIREKFYPVTPSPFANAFSFPSNPFNNWGLFYPPFFNYFSPFNLPAHPALRLHFYSDIPLSPVSPTTISVYDRATRASRFKTVAWQPCNIAMNAGKTFYLRKGDSLLLQNTTSQNGIVISAPNGTQTTLPPSFYFQFGLQGTPFVFNEIGEWLVKVSAYGHTSVLTVQVSAADLAPVPTTIQGFFRTWTPALLDFDTLLEADDNLLFLESPAVNGKRTLYIQSENSLPQRILARLGLSGPVLDVTTVNVLENSTRAVTAWDIQQTYPDGTVLWKATISIGGNIPPEFKIKLTMWKSGSLFDDGTTVRWIYASDFSADGTYVYYMLLPVEVEGSACHSAFYYDGDNVISNQL